MLSINFANVEELIFSNEDVHHLLPPYFFSYFEQWKLSKRIPSLRSFGKTAILDFLNQINESHVEVLEEYFQDRVYVEKLNYNNVVNVKIPLSNDDLCNQLCEIVGINYYSMWRDDMHLYISFWR